MQDRAEVLIIGGGAVGCSIAFHLTRKGCRDVVLCEKHELASGATAFAAGHVILYALNPTISRLNRYSVDLYGRLEAETGMSPGFHACGNLRIATHSRRLDEFRRYLGVAEATGAEARLLTPEEIGTLWPFMSTDGVLGGLYNPQDGHIAPADLTQSLAAGARQGGARIQRGCEVTALSRMAGGFWRVETSRGTIIARHVVAASGNHAQSVAGMLGLTAQCVPVRHQYFVTEPLTELAERRRAGLPEMPVMRDPEDVFYCRQEGDALLVGAYDGRGEARFVSEPPAGMAEPFPDEMEKLLPYLERAVERVPMLGTAGVRRVVNYAMPYTPDDLPTVGPAFGTRNLWLAEGNPFGITLAGGIGWQMAEWILEGAPSVDMACCDTRRFGEWATREWSARKVEEAYEHTYLLPKPGEELPAARDLRTSPIHDLLAARGARFGAVAGWERPNWFAPEGAVDEPSFYRPNWHSAVGAECRAATAGVALADVSHGAAIRVSGAGAAALLGRVLSVAPPAPGKASSGYLLAPNGGIEAEVAVARDGDEGFVLNATAVAERRVLDALHRSAPSGNDLWIENLTAAEGALLLLGPAARQHLQKATSAALDDEAFPRGAVRTITIGHAPVRVHHADPFGRSGYRLHVRADMLRHVFLALEEGAALIGARALESLRLEAAEAAWPEELNVEVTPAMAEGAPGTTRQLIHLQIEGADTMPHGTEPVRDETGRIVGRTTSGGWGHLGNKALAFALLDPWAGGLEVRVMGAWHPAAPTKGTAGTEDEIMERTLA
ncbi:FAD-dependent oxidoreductase [Defluviimonas salinarum]|uniref:FAD-dependent oxidoreductase n=1 Tax=Defluviimonas salinarum TaxID=2992147 RepID=A0ABT3J7S4_9RHOB|nr:FAD-dependent oxidoreductase [Defluviimonas salinarum]